MKDKIKEKLLKVDFLVIDSEELAKFMHDDYERVSKIIGWNTQDKCKVEFKDLPDENKQVMIAVACNIMEFFNQKGYKIIEKEKAIEETKKAEQDRILELIKKYLSGLREDKDCYEDIKWFLEELKKEIKNE